MHYYYKIIYLANHMKVQQQETNFVFLVKSPRMKSTASVEMDENKSSGKSRFTCEMLSIVSCLELPANGAHPVSMTYANTPTLLYQTHHVFEKLHLTYRMTTIQ